MPSPSPPSPRDCLRGWPRTAERSCDHAARPHRRRCGGRRIAAGLVCLAAQLFRRAGARRTGTRLRRLADRGRGRGGDGRGPAARNGAGRDHAVAADRGDGDGRGLGTGRGRPRAAQWRAGEYSAGGEMGNALVRAARSGGRARQLFREPLRPLRTVRRHGGGEHAPSFRERLPCGGRGGAGDAGDGGGGALGRRVGGMRGRRGDRDAWAAARSLRRAGGGSRANDAARSTPAAAPGTDGRTAARRCSGKQRLSPPRPARQGRWQLPLRGRYTPARHGLCLDQARGLGNARTGRVRGGGRARSRAGGARALEILARGSGG